MSENQAKNEKNEEKRQYNLPFLRAFEYLARILTNGNNGMLAQMIGTNGGHISDWKAGRKRVSNFYMDELVRVSVSANMPIHKEFLLGKSNIMLLDNVTEEERERVTNPDYEAMQKKAAEPLNDPTADLVDLCARVIKEVEYLRKQLTEEIAEVHTLRMELSATLHQLRGQYQSPNLPTASAAETTTK